MIEKIVTTAEILVKTIRICSTTSSIGVEQGAKAFEEISNSGYGWAVVFGSHLTQAINFWVLTAWYTFTLLLVLVIKGPLQFNLLSYLRVRKF
ncbi:hypothetical protein BDB00DRAFT_850396 [Zychaea mexicana]|uniref:uncharacterized protein n=1 Tax=Zychaea mexicana TaxID=64656 RepID=UPI0022FEBFEE|nr:uncharacterized protein BDB00DRAFT_850396 [Zychaea mexicana]KAI9488034.1 hypothetical protein BDB00DRAFT_850396 [Zychaea mexicana]